MTTNIYGMYSIPGWWNLPLIEEYESAGKVLFRLRSYLPFVLVILILVSLSYVGEPFQSSGLNLIWELFCVAVSLSGLFVRVLTIGYAPPGTSGRNTRNQVADTLSTRGMYSLVRHPLYLGNFLMGLGASLILVKTWWIPAIYSMSFALYYERIMFAEENFLRTKFSGAYLKWASATPAILPRLKGWVQPVRGFSFRLVLRREYQSAFGLGLAMFLAEQVTESGNSGWFSPDKAWLVFVIILIFVYLAIRILHKMTGVLASR